MTNLKDFQSDIATHEMRILRDEGVYRHVRFSRPNTSITRFDLITWPGVLCYTGDMGTFVFSRTFDMFEFFRTDDRKHDGGIYINTGYWSEKLLAVDGGRDGGSATEFDPEKFQRAIKEILVDWIRYRNLSREGRRALREAVQDDVLGPLTDAEEHECHDLARSFKYEFDGRKFSFYDADLWDRSFTRPTYHFLWCCYAIAWGVMQYDAQSAKWEKAIGRGATLEAQRDALLAALVQSRLWTSQEAGRVETQAAQLAIMDHAIAAVKGGAV